MSTIPTCAVRAVVRDSIGGLPIAGARITARLSSFEFYEGFVVPRQEIEVTDANGIAVLNLFPNELGSASSFYDVSIAVPGGKTLKTVAVIPSLAEVDLSDVSEVPTYEGKPDGAVTLAAVNALGSEIKGYRDTASSAASSAGDSAAAASGSAGVSVEAAENAEESASSAATAENAASNAAVVAHDERTLAEAAQAGAQLASNIALARGRTYATPAGGVNAAGSPPGVAVGEYFTVPSSNSAHSLDLYQNAAGVAVLQQGKSIPAAEAMFGFKATLAAGVALTTAVLQGVYFCVPNAGYTDVPAGFDVTKNAALIVEDASAVNGRFKIQKFYRWDRLGDQWIRLVDTTGAGTSDWVQGAVPGDGTITTPKLPDKAVSRGKLADGYDYISSIGAETDLNALVQSGNHITTARPVNMPAAGSATGYVTVESFSSGTFVVQTYRNIADPSQAWTRYTRPANAFFGPWMDNKVADGSVVTAKLGDRAATRAKLADGFSYVGQIDGTADANALTVTGIYLATAKPTNAPAAAGASGYLNVDSYNGASFVIQTWRDLTNPGNFWVRYIRPLNASFGAWISNSGAPADNSIGYSKLTSAYSYAGTLASTETDANTITATGVYLATARPQNTPANSTATGYLIVENFNGGSFITQTWRNLLAPAQAWIRYIRPNNGPTFGEWTYLAAAVSPFAGKTFALFGDSKVEFGDIPARIGARLGFATSLKFGFGGCRMAVHSNPNYNEMSMYRLAAAIASGNFAPLLAACAALAPGDDNTPQATLLSTTNFNLVDIAGIAYGPNDFNAPIPIGNDDDMVPTTFSGATNLSIRDIQSTYPKMGLYLVTPTWRARQSPNDGKDSDTVPNSAGVFHSEFVNAILRAGDRHHLPVLDLSKTSGINKYTNTSYLNDGLHNTEPFGLQRMADKHAAFIASTF